MGQVLFINIKEIGILPKNELIILHFILSRKYSKYNNKVTVKKIVEAIGIDTKWIYELVNRLREKKLIRKVNEYLAINFKRLKVLYGENYYSLTRFYSNVPKDKAGKKMGTTLFINTDEIKSKKFTTSELFILHLILAMRYGKFPKPIRNKIIRETFNTSKSYVNRALSKLDRKGIIIRSEFGGISIDFRNLKEYIGEEAYNNLKKFYANVPEVYEEKKVISYEDAFKNILVIK